MPLQLKPLLLPSWVAIFRLETQFVFRPGAKHDNDPATLPNSL